MTKEISNIILDRLNALIPNPVCELNFNNTFELVCAVLLSAQTTDKRVNIVTKKLFREYPNPEALMNASYDKVYEIINSLGFAKIKAQNLISMSRIIHESYNDLVPSEFELLTALPGVGRKTASVIQIVGFKIPAMPVDTHIHRMAFRLGYTKKDTSVEKTEETLKKYIPVDRWIDAHHLLLLFGRYYCKAISPCCSDCVVKEYCKKDRGRK